MRIVATNKKATFNYKILSEFTAGIQLFGTEVKSIRNGHVSIQEGYCFITKELEVLCTGMYIKEYKQAFKDGNHDPNRVKKLLQSPNIDFSLQVRNINDYE
jgi:SsrA-binding protein